MNEEPAPPNPPTPASRLRRIARRFAILCLIAALALGGWVQWGEWPSATSAGEPEWQPDAILVLGGGDIDRPHEALRLAEKFPHIPVLVTGDGGMIYDKLLHNGLPEARLIHETEATSTLENARFTRSTLDQIHAQHVLLVTDWFHVPRSLAIFEREQPNRQFFPSFREKPEHLNAWHAYCARRERLAAIHNLVRYGIWSF